MVYPLPRTYQTQQGNKTTKDYMQKNVQELEKISKTPKYLDFAKKVVGLATSKDAENYITFKEEPHLTQEGVFTFTLNDTTYISDVNGFVMQQHTYNDEKTGEQKVQELILGNTYDVNSDGKGTYTDNFNGKWLCLPDGQPLRLYGSSYQAQSNRQEDGYQVYVTPIVLKRDGKSYQVFLSLYQSRSDVSSIECGGYVNTTKVNEAIATALNGSTDELIHLKSGDVIAPTYEIYSGDGNSKFVDGKDYTVGKDINSFKVSYQDLPHDNIYNYEFVIFDVYRGINITDIAVFKIDKDGKVKYDPELIK